MQGGFYYKHARYIIGYHKDGQVCLILENLKFSGGGWGFGMVENENRLKTVFVLVAVEVLCIKCPRTAFAVVVVKCIILHFLKKRVYRQQ